MADYYTFRKWSVTAHGHQVAVVGPGDRVLDLQQRLSPKGPRASVSRRGQNGLIAAALVPKTCCKQVPPVRF
jgi:hypothetical protein